MADLLDRIKHLKTAFEAGGRQAMGIRLTPEQAVSLRWELHQMYGFDPGESLTTLYGLEVLSTEAEQLTFEE
ncbi:MAG: hypothetical protein HQL56_05280 [Magnetococcales bacterium]|nr:hypothetical protein [Magnetococcales bacterium]